MGSTAMPPLRLYAYTVRGRDQERWSRRGKSGVGAIKVGQTRRESARQRIKEQLGTAFPDLDGVTILMDVPALLPNGKELSDREIHAQMQSAGVRHIAGEWFEADLDDVYTAMARLGWTGPRPFPVVPSPSPETLGIKPTSNTSMPKRTFIGGGPVQEAPSPQDIVPRRDADPTSAPEHAPDPKEDGGVGVAVKVVAFVLSVAVLLGAVVGFSRAIDLAGVGSIGVAWFLYVLMALVLALAASAIAMIGRWSSGILSLLLMVPVKNWWVALAQMRSEIPLSVWLLWGATNIVLSLAIPALWLVAFGVVDKAGRAATRGHRV